MATVFFCRDSACWLTLIVSRVRRHLHKRGTVETDKTPTSMLMEKQAWRAESVDKIAIY